VGSDSIYVQWQISLDGGATWAALPGEFSTTLILNSLSREMDSALIRAVFTNVCDSAFSQPALLVVPWLAVVEPTGGETFCAGQQFELQWTGSNVERVSLLLSGDGGTSWTVIASNISGSSYLWTIPTGLVPGGDYRIRIVQSGTSQPAAATTPGEFAIHTSASVISQPGDVTVNPGSGATFSVTAGGFPTVSYQWQTMPPGGSWQDIPTATGSSLFVGNITAAQTGTRYRVIVQNPCGADTSREALVTVSGGTGVESSREIESVLSLSVRPTPAADGATLDVTTGRSGIVRIEVFDARGGIVRATVLGPVGPGRHSVPIDASDLPAGTYRCRASARGSTAETELIVIR
jgi:hypothetical protein